MNITQEITAMLVKELAVEENEVVAGAYLEDDLDADSLVLLTMADAISELYDIKLTGDDLGDVETVGEFIALVEQRVAAKAG